MPRSVLIRVHPRPSFYFALFTVFRQNLMAMSNSDQIARFRNSLCGAMSTYGVELSEEMQILLGAYFELFSRWNERLHLVAPCSAEEFATRHVLESLTLINRLPQDAKVADVGSGAGLPGIPCLIARPDLTVTLIESSQKKSVFLREALKTIGALKRATIVSKPFEESIAPEVEFVTCRALDDFTAKLPGLVHWAPQGSSLLLFGGENLKQRLATLKCDVEESLLPGSQRRFVFEVRKASADFTKQGAPKNQ
jgi:16S rRNA (guanine527-N7)-methyltransferase